MSLADPYWLLGGVAGALLTVTAFLYFSKKESFQLGRSLRYEDCEWQSKRFLVLCNPVGGKKQGELIVKQVVQPLCVANSIAIDVIYTERAKHAYDVAANTDFSGYGGVLLVSGDGLIHEFLNGLAAQARKGNASSAFAGGSQEEKEFLSFLASFPPIGVLPGGTCNGVCSTLHSPDPVKAMQAIIRGSARPVDLYHVVSPSMLAAPVNDGKKGNKGAVINAWDVHYFSWAVIAEANDIIERKVSYLLRTDAVW